MIIRYVCYEQAALYVESETVGIYFACNTLAIVSARTRRIPQLLRNRTERLRCEKAPIHFERVERHL
jgi:hypothetical protein